MEDQFDSCWKCATPQGGSHSDAPGIPSGGDEGEMTERFASEIARQRKWALERRAHVKIPRAWFSAWFIAGIVAACGMWFRSESQRQMMDFKGAIAAGVGTFLLGYGLWRVSLPTPLNAAKCPQCGYAWDIPRNGHDWLKWKFCPGCGLKMM